MVECIGSAANRSWHELTARRIVVWSNMQLGALKKDPPSQSAFAELATVSDSGIDMHVELIDSIETSDSALCRLESRTDTDGRVLVMAAFDVNASAERVFDAIGRMIDEGIEAGCSYAESGELVSFDQRTKNIDATS
ncbi:MAG: hypothetical protein AAF432_02245 [Planctomycetota bacterium]